MVAPGHYHLLTQVPTGGPSSPLSWVPQVKWLFGRGVSREAGNCCHSKLVLAASSCELVMPLSVPVSVTHAPHSSSSPRLRNGLSFSHPVSVCLQLLPSTPLPPAAPRSHLRPLRTVFPSPRKVTGWKQSPTPCGHSAPPNVPHSPPHTQAKTLRVLSAFAWLGG